MQKKNIKDIDVSGKKVLIRVDFNVPMDDSFRITDDGRIKASLPSINYLIEKGARLIICSHLGRPKGKINDKYSLKPVANRLSELISKPVLMAEDVVGESAKRLSSELKDGDVMLIENVRFTELEERNDPEFAKELASLADIFVNDAFAAAHRAHASTVGVTRYIPAVCGLLMEKEIDVMGHAIECPMHPFVAVLGGAKVSDKIGLINNLLSLVDYILIGGGMGYTFLRAKGFNIGASLLEEEKVTLARELMENAEKKGVKIILASDTVVADKFANDANFQTVDADKIPDGFMGLDIGPKTIEEFSKIITSAKTVIWNGPMGVFEMENFRQGTLAVAKAMSETEGTTIVGGGDSAAAVVNFGLGDKMTHISTGGGASLEFLGGDILPGVACILER